ncbi:MAG: M28 family peptidase [Bacteroidota bacterium]
MIKPKNIHLKGQRRYLPLLLLSYLISFLLFEACEDEKKRSNSKKTASFIEVPSFNEDSAYVYVEKQLSFGPRVPNSAGHINCGNWLGNFLEKQGAKVYRQAAVLTAFNGDQLSSQNIIAAFNPEAQKRVMISAHWDTRPFAEQDRDPARKNEPIMGANDGASGVGVLLEIARQMKAKAPKVGVDIFLWDSEDYGNPGTPDSYCLGTQYWAKNKHIPNYQASFGINLDMVGAEDAQFYKEENSVNYAAWVIEKVWLSASLQGYGNYFSHVRSNPVTDDHLYVNKLGGIPCIDIIDQRNGGGFFEQWHTHGDDLSVISRNTLKAVGQTVLDVIYRE